MSDKMPDKLYVGSVYTDANGGKDYIGTDFGIDGDTEYIRADLVNTPDQSEIQSLRAAVRAMASELMCAYSGIDTPELSGLNKHAEIIKSCEIE